MLLAVALVTVTIGGLTINDWSAARTADEPAPLDRRQVTVTEVIDGDTLTATDAEGGNLGRLRALGIDTPEMARHNQPAECYAQDATDAAEQLLQDATLRISHDPSQDTRDRYGRLLVYIDIGEADYAQTMLAKGNARLYSQETTLRRHATYVEAEKAARSAGAGLWGQCSWNNGVTHDRRASPAATHTGSVTRVEYTGNDKTVGATAVADHERRSRR